MDRSRFRGTGVALVTPFKKGKVDYDALHRIIEHTLSGGVNYLVFLGTTGESVTLTQAEHRQIIDFGIKTVAGRVPVVAGIFGDNDTKYLIDKVKKFNFDGVDAILSSSPAYNKPSQEGIYQHYMQLAEKSPVPIIIYNVPSRTSSNITAATTLRLAHASNNFLGIKEASNDLAQITTIIKHCPEDFLVISGDDFNALPIIASGGDGVISVIGNALPQQFSQLVTAALADDYKTAQEKHLLLLELYTTLFIEGNPAGVKAALALQNLCADEVRLPLTAMTKQGKKLLADQMKLIGVL